MVKKKSKEATKVRTHPRQVKISAKKSFLIAFFLLITDCVSQKKFAIEKVLTNPTYDDLHIIKTQPDRIIQECLFLDAEAENKWRHQYSMYILNDKNEVIPVTYSIHLEKSVCLEHSKKVEKILKNTSEVTLCLRDKFTIDPNNSEKQDFGKLGQHQIKYEYLTFDSICNSKECYSVSDTFTTTCPGFKK